MGCATPIYVVNRKEFGCRFSAASTLPTVSGDHLTSTV